MKIIKLPVNQCWVLTITGSDIQSIKFDSGKPKRLFSSKSEIASALQNIGLSVDSKNNVS